MSQNVILLPFIVNKANNIDTQFRFAQIFCKTYRPIIWPYDNHTTYVASCRATQIKDPQDDRSINNKENQSRQPKDDREKTADTGYAHYFGTKEELINQLYLSIKQDLRRALAVGVDAEKTIWGMMHKGWCNFIAWSLENPAKLQFFMQFSSSPYISNLTREEGIQTLGFLHDLIEEGKRQDVLKNIPTELLFDITTGMCQTMGLHFQNNPEKFDDKRYREMAFESYWDCIRR